MTFFQRPTARSLLKHEFLKKKCKDKAFLVKTLLSEHPPLEKRSAKLKRVPGTSGRLHKTEDGGWEWYDHDLERHCHIFQEPAGCTKSIAF